MVSALFHLARLLAECYTILNNALIAVVYKFCFISEFFYLL